MTDSLKKLISMEASKMYLVYVVRKSTKSIFAKGIFDRKEDAAREADYLSKKEDYEVFTEEVYRNQPFSLWM